MQQSITAKLKLTTTPEQFAALRHIQLAYRDALNAVSRYAFSCGKTGNVTRLHKGMYTELRTRSHLPSPLACSVERQVAATYKGLWTKLKKNSEHRQAKITKKRFKGLDKPPKYRSPTVQYTYERDYTFQCDSRVSIGTLNGRASVSLIRAMTNTRLSFEMGQSSETPNGGMTGQRNSSLCWCP